MRNLHFTEAPDLPTVDLPENHYFYLNESSCNDFESKFQAENDGNIEMWKIQLIMDRLWRSLRRLIQVTSGLVAVAYLFYTVTFFPASALCI